MAKRGRPPHDDVLTPREWEVLALIRQGLSNDEIASRLGISLDGVKYHVSEILGKLGLENRHDAARWLPEERRPPLLAPLFFLRRLDFGWLGNAVACALLAIVVGAAAVLAWALLGTNDSGPPTTQAGEPPIVRIEITSGGTNRLTGSSVDPLVIARMLDAMLSLPTPAPCTPTAGARYCVFHCRVPPASRQYHLKFVRADEAVALTADITPGGGPCSPRSVLEPGGQRYASTDSAIWPLVADVLGVHSCEVLAPSYLPRGLCLSISH